VHLSTVDLLYVDLYLHRAEALLLQVCTREHHRALRHDQARLPSAIAQLQRAAEHADWSKVRSLAQEAARARDRVASGSQILPLADAVYGPRVLHADAVTLALNGVVTQSDTNLTHARDAVLGQLRMLASQDTEYAPFYRLRIAYFESCQIESSEIGPAVDATKLQQQILTAVTAGDFARVQRLADAIVAEPTARSSRLRAPRPHEDRVRELAVVFPNSVVARAADIGLTMETLPRIGGLNEYLSCCCVDRATFPEQPLSGTDRSVENCTCGHACPPEVRPSLRENLDFLIGHPFICSAGLRYLPWFGPETVLVETFPETDPDARNDLLTGLGLPKRRGLSRLMIEDALLTNGARVCTQLGLDPMEFVVACIPFDAYVRLAPKYHWGQQEHWTHFDGYQVTRELRLWAMVGGNARFSGADNLSSLVRDYDPEGLTTRFAILRRQRFLAREVQGVNR